MPEEKESAVADREMKGARVVTVACNLPHGLQLNHFHWETFYEPVIGGGTRETKRSVRGGETVVIFGVARERSAAPKAPIVAGYALTHDIDAAFWEEWVKQNADHAAVVNRCIFAYPSTDRVKGKASEMQSGRFKSGMEPMNPDGDPRSPKRKGMEVKKADSQAA